MIINRRTITMEMTQEEFSTIARSLRKLVVDTHTNLLFAESRKSSDAHINFTRKNLQSAIVSYEMFSGKTYDLYEEELKIRDRIPSLEKSF